MLLPVFRLIIFFFLVFVVTMGMCVAVLLFIIMRVTVKVVHNLGHFTIVVELTRPDGLVLFSLS